MLTEISRTSIPVSKYEEIFIKWHNSVLSVRVDKGIQLFDFEHNVQCFDKNINMSAVMVSSPKSSALKDLIPDNFFKKNTSNLNIIETILNPSLWPANADIMEEMANIADFQWSEVGMAHNNECLLATLTNVGNVDLFCRGRYNWSNVMDLSNVNKLRLEATDNLKPPESFEQLQTLAGLLESTSICWGLKLKPLSCFFAMAQKNGTVLFWLIENESEIKVTFLTEFDTETEIVAMAWIQRSNDEFFLICTDIFGGIFAFKCAVENMKIKAVNKCSLWSYKDKMVSKVIRYLVVNDKIVLIYPKHRHLVIQMIDKECNVISQFVQNVNEYKITDVILNNNGIYLTTVNGKIFKVDINVEDNNVTANLINIMIKDFHSKYELFGMALSTNNAIIALAVINVQVAYRKSKKSIEIIFVTDSEFPELNLLLDNPAKTLTQYRDCVELFRYKIMKNRTLPQLNYEELYGKCDTDVYKLKIYLIITYFYNMLEKVPRNGIRIKIPVISVEFLKEKTLVFHARQVLSELFEIYRKTGVTLDCFKLESYTGAKNFIEYYCNKYNKNISEFSTAKVLNIPNEEPNLLCQWCDSKIEGFSCKSGHLNMFCMLTFTLINSDEYLICKGCNYTAKTELYLNNPKCVFCDLYLHKVF